jgi:hypothetical protein
MMARQIGALGFDWIANSAQRTASSYSCAIARQGGPRAGPFRSTRSRAGAPDGGDDALVRVARLLAPAPDWTAFLAGGLGAEERAAIRAASAPAARSARPRSPPASSAASAASLVRRKPDQATRRSTRRTAHRPEFGNVSAELSLMSLEISQRRFASEGMPEARATEFFTGSTR